MPRRLIRFARKHPYWTCVSRAFMFGMVRTIFISAVVHQAPLLVIASEWWLAKHSSKNVGMRSRTELPNYDNFWASGSVLGVSAGLAIVFLIVQSSDGVTSLDPWTWPTVDSIKRLAGWVSSFVSAEPASFARLG